MDNSTVIPDWDNAKPTHSNKAAEAYIQAMVTEQVPVHPAASKADIANFARHIDAAQNNDTPQSSRNTHTDTTSLPQEGRQSVQMARPAHKTAPVGHIIQPAANAHVASSPISTAQISAGPISAGPTSADQEPAHPNIPGVDPASMAQNSQIAGNKAIRGSTTQTDFSCTARCRPDVAENNQESGRERGMPRKYQVQKGLGLSAPTSINAPSFLDGVGFRINEIADMKNGGGGQITGATNQGTKAGGGAAGMTTSTGAPGAVGTAGAKGAIG